MAGLILNTGPSRLERVIAKTAIAIKFKAVWDIIIQEIFFYPSRVVADIARLNELCNSVGAIPPWLPRCVGVGTGALPLQIYINDSDALYISKIQEPISANSNHRAVATSIATVKASICSCSFWTCETAPGVAL